MKPQKTTVALVDDHVLLRNGLCSLINSFKDFEVQFEADNGADMIKQLLKETTAPAIILLDINMPEMNGFETLAWLKEYMPDVKVIMLSVMDTEAAIVRCIKGGARTFLRKDSKPSEFIQALSDVRDTGFYMNRLVTDTMLKYITGEGKSSNDLFYPLTVKEEEFVKLICTDLTYKEIAQEMNLSLRTIDGYREELFRKLKINSRVGLVLYAIRRGLFKL